MTKQEAKQEVIEQATYEANSAKRMLIHIMAELEEAGAIRKAKASALLSRSWKIGRINNPAALR